jgi:cation transport ATPase
LAKLLVRIAQGRLRLGVGGQMILEAVALAGHGGGITAEAANVVVLIDDIARVPEAMRISRRTVQIARQCIAVGLGLSVIGMIAAAAGALTPTAGALT